MNKHKYRSGFEALIAMDLRERGVAFEYENITLEFKTRVVKGVCPECGCKRVHQLRSYTPDFVIPREGRTDLYVEAKGILDSKTRSKMRAVRQSNPDLDIRLLFDGKATWKRGKEMIKWCDKFGFPYAFGTSIPQEWLT